MPTAGGTQITIRDYDNEPGTTRIHAAVLTAANFDAQVTARNAFCSALLAITTADMLAKISFGNDILNTMIGDTNAETQREKKWLVRYHENATPTVTGTFTIPCADLLHLDPNDRKHANIGDAGHVDAFIAAAETFVLSPAGNAIVIDEITYVGRNT
jgi:hypothetical protein